MRRSIAKAGTATGTLLAVPVITVLTLTLAGCSGSSAGSGRAATTPATAASSAATRTTAGSGGSAGSTGSMGSTGSSGSTGAPGSGTAASTRGAAPARPSSSTASSGTAVQPFGVSTASTAAARRALAAMSETQRVGQLLMVDCPTTGVTAATATAITDAHAGAVILDGTTHEGLAAVQAVTGQLRRLAPAGAGLLIATDQEGGEVQRLQGSGFATIPSAVQQGLLAPSTLQSDARQWGEELRRAGVRLNLAPVLDTVPADSGSNPPIGDLDREYGSTPTTVSAHGLAFLRGMAQAGVDATAKHFPGLGRVTGNTDTTAGVTDHVTTANDPYLAPYAAAVRAGVPFVMMSTAIYARIDPGRPAAFSSTIVTGLLRDRLGFRGVVISDDLGAAAQVAGYSPGQRAVDFVAAGGDMALTVDASEAGPMTAALVAKARSSSTFRAQVDAAALRVLVAKQALGLL